MEKIRKGNDISILWEIMRGTEEVPYDLTGKDLTLYIKSMYKTEKVTDFTTDGNVLKWTFAGKNQGNTGVYSLVLVENEGKDNMHTVDACDAFELVNCSCKVGGDAESHVQIKIVSLRSAILLSAILPDKELDTNSTNVVENGAIAREFEATNKRIDELKVKHEEDITEAVKEVLGGASEAYNTLKEIEEYIEKDEAGAVILAQNIAKNAKAIEDSPFEKGEGENSSILKGDNIAKGVKSVALGSHSKALKNSSVALNYGCEANGNYSIATGNQSITIGESSHAEGHKTKAEGGASHSEGRSTKAVGNNSHAEGYGTIASAENSHAEGKYTKTSNDGEHAEGKYNKSNTGTIHSVGIGTSDTDRKNAHEITTDGKHYILGIGGYDGTKLDGATDVATELTNLSKKVNNLPQGSSMTSIIYADLVGLRDNGKLVAGSYYRINDYITTTSQTNTQSAGHPFDVIVLALSENTLAEDAYAIQSERDTDGYFANSNLAAWQIWYCLDNDAERFAWAVPTSSGGKGVIYRMIDEHNNDCPYDFKNMQFRHPNDTVNYPNYYYTFSTVISGVVSDHSHSGAYCYGNKIGFKIINGVQRLNNIVFVNLSKTNLCNSNSFGDNCNANSFGDNCSANSFGDNCYYNSFGDNCNSNSFGDNCYYNSFDYFCQSNSFGNECYSNKFGNNCRNNSFGEKCYKNRFGNGSYGNSFKNNCRDNSFGIGCGYNSFGDSCKFICFGESADNIKSYYRYITFDNGNSYINLNCTTTTSTSNYYQNVRIGLGVNNKYTYKTINDSNVGQTYETLYKPANSKELTA